MPTNTDLEWIQANFAEQIARASTQFDTLIGDSTTSLLDVPSTYPFNSERHALVQEGSVTDSEFVDNPGEFQLSVNGNSGDAHELKARQRLTYQPNYELLWGAGYYMQNELEPGQRLTVALTNPARDNGYFTEITAGGQRTYILNSGMEIDSREWGSQDERSNPYTNGLDETQPQVHRQYLTWYGDGSATSTLHYAGADSVPQNPRVATVANRGDVATGEINLQISIRLECTEATAANTVNVLSYGALNRGGGSFTNRTKPANNFGLGGAIGSTDFTPICAVRRRSGFEEIPTQLDNYEIVPTDAMEVAAVAFPEGTTDATDWNVPPQQDPENTATEQTTNISTFPTDANGEPDGRLIDIVIATASGNKGDRAEADVQDEFYEDEELVFLARTKAASNSSVDLLYDTRQEW